MADLDQNGGGDADWQAVHLEQDSDDDSVSDPPSPIMLSPRPRRKNGYIAAAKVEQLGKRVTYLLRYGAVREGLDVHSGGYIEINQLLSIPLMKKNTREEVEDLVATAKNHRDTPRFEVKSENGTLYIRARHRQQMERSPYHEGTKINRLLEVCMTKISENLKEYDFEGFPDLYLYNSILHRLRRKKLLNNTALRNVLSPSVELLNLQGVYLTPTSFKIIATQCPNLRVLNLHGAGYVLNDHFTQQLFKKLPLLESLNLSGCHHLTDRTLTTVVKNVPDLVHLVASGNRHYTERAILDLVLALTRLVHLDIYNNPNVSDEGRQALVDVGRQRKLTVVLKGLTDKTVAPEDPAMVLSVWREGLT